MSIWNNLELELEREIARQKLGRMSFDCFNLKVKGKRVHCAKGYLLGRARDGSLDLMAVLRGITSGTCKTCKDFDGGE